jgi:hypothetical protein
MDVSVWWVLVGAGAGVCIVIVLFAVMTMAADREPELEFVSDGQAPTRT